MPLFIKEEEVGSLVGIEDAIGALETLSVTGAATVRKACRDSACPCLRRCADST